MAKDKRTRDQKRKAKLAKGRQLATKSNSLAYMGDKYKAKEFVQTLMNAEIGIYEAYVMLDRKLLDRTVIDAIEALIKMMRAGSLPPLSGINHEVGQEEDLVVANIRRNWVRHFATEWRPSKEERIGVLRTILGSIERTRSASPTSQSYLRHIAGFLTKQLGVKVEAFRGEITPMPKIEEGSTTTANLE